MRIAINGFGRIGRTILRQVLSGPARGVEVVRINDIATPEMCAYLFQYDSTFGPYAGTVEAQDGMLIVDGRGVTLSRADNLSQIDLSGVDVVLE